MHDNTACAADGPATNRRLGVDTCAQSLNVPTRALQSIAEQINMMNDMAYRLWSNMSGEIDRISGRTLLSESAGKDGAAEPASEIEALRMSANRLHDHLAACLDTAGRLTSI